jgi:hypothetical protein
MTFTACFRWLINHNPSMVDKFKKLPLSEERWAYVVGLDDELLLGGAVTSAKTEALIQNADIAYCNGAPLATIILSAAAIESHLRFDYQDETRSGLADLIDRSTLDSETKGRLHELRKERNRWVHSREDFEADSWLYDDIAGEEGLDSSAREALRLMRIVLYSDRFV